MSTEAFGETLQFITNVKLAELGKRNDRFVHHVSQVKEKANAHGNTVARLQELVNGLKQWPAARSADFNLGDIKLFIEQARRDPAFPPSVIDEWTRKAEAQFTFENTRYDFAQLFGTLLNEWLQSKSPSAVSSDASMEDDSGDRTMSPVGFEKISRKETIEQKEKLESLIFEEKKVDVKALNTYLVDLFSSKEASEELEMMRKRIKKFSQDLRERSITLTELKQIIQSVLQTDVLSEEKQATLKEFLRNRTVMKELASVLNMQLSTIKSWSWPSTGVLLEPRRHLNGRTRFHLDTEILTCLLLHYLGMLWSVEFKKNLEMLFSSRIWKRSPARLTRIDHKRWDVFFGKETQDGSIEKLRREYQKEHFFMCQLPSNFEVMKDNYKEDADEDCDYSTTDNQNCGPRFDSPIDLKQSLLHILSADVVMSKALHGRCTVVRTDLEWFGPSLPVATIVTVLRFFGMPEENVEFIIAFLQCPIVFKDDPSKQVRTRKRGVPISYMLSTLCGELVLSIMDFAVNQKADGLFLHRIHDDFWFWDSQSPRCVAAWTEMQRYATVAGLSFNVEKTGSVVIGNDVLNNGLPKGDVRWGFLRMNNEGRFVIDQAMIDQHVIELRRQLKATTSIFSWIQAYNKYLLFIVRNCGAPAVVYGVDHIDEIIDTLTRVQVTLFNPSEGGGAQICFTTALAKLIEDKLSLSIGDLPYGWYVWPNAAGGLEVKDPLVDLFLLRDGYKGRSVADILRLTHTKDEWRYANAKEKWERGDSVDLLRSSRFLSSDSPDFISSSDPFFSFEEFTKAREERGPWWCNAYRELLERPKLSNIECTPQLEASLKLLGDGVEAFGGSRRSSGSWSSLRPYWQWIIAMHHDVMVKKFGSLAIVEPTSVPVGMVSVFKGSRMKWEQ